MKSIAKGAWMAAVLLAVTGLVRTHPVAAQTAATDSTTSSSTHAIAGDLEKVSADGKNGLFNRPELAKAFNQRLKTIYELKQRFLMANAAYLASQRAAREQVGMDP